MDRRALLAGFAGSSLMLAVAPGSALARPGGVDATKLPALMGGDFSTATSRLAERRARSRAVRTFAELEIEEQAAVAKAFGARPGQAGIDRAHTAVLARLERASGASFDRMYVESQIAGHNELLKIHRRYAASGSDPEARGASIVGVTGIKSHLAMLKAIEASLS